MTKWPMPNSISPSRMGLFLQCPLKFRLETIQRIGGSTNAAAVAGTCMHAALEELMKLPPEERTVEALKPLIEQALVDIREDADYKSLTTEQLKDFDAKCRRVAPRAFEMTKLDLTSVNVESTELAFEVDLDGWILRGRIDWIEGRPDFGRIVWDWKTGKAPWTRYQDKALLGLEFYAVALTRLFDEIPAGVGLLYIAERKAIKRVPTPKSVEATERKILAVRDAIGKACDHDSFGTSTSTLCNYCAFKPVCPAHGGTPPDDIRPRGEVRS